MATPTPMKHAPSQQGRTPSGTQHGVAATPPVSTPFSAAFSPHGPKSSPQHVRRSPATSTTLMGHPSNSNAPVTFDSPTAAALGALGIGNGLDIGSLDNVGVVGGLDGLGGMATRDDDDEKIRRLHRILSILKESKGRVSDAGLERLVRSVGLEFLWEEGGGSDKSKTLIIAGSALSIDIVMANNIVEKVTLSFPDSSDVVSQHVEQAGRILLDDLKLGPSESPLTKKLNRFAVNLERLAVLDKLSVIPGFNCHEAIANIYGCLERLHQWDMSKLRADPAMAGRGEERLLTTALCSRNGQPGMHKRGKVGLTLDYWRERHLVPPPASDSTELRENMEATERAWSIWVGCAPLIAMGYQPARISDAWLSPAIEKHASMVGEDHLLMTANQLFDWQDPPNTVIPGEGGDQQQQKTDGMDVDNSGRLPAVVFSAEFDPPVVMTLQDWEHIQQIAQAPLSEFLHSTYDSLMFPVPENSQHDPTEPRSITRLKEVAVYPPLPRDVTGATAAAEPTKALHRNSLFIYKPVYGRTLSSVPFSHPSQLVEMLPRLRQYAFLSTLLERSFGPVGAASAAPAGDGDTESGAAAPTVTGLHGSAPGRMAGLNATAGAPRQMTQTQNLATTTTRADFAAFLAGPKDPAAAPAAAGIDQHDGDKVQGQHGSTDGAISGGDASGGGGGGGGAAGPALPIDVTLTVHPVPRLQVVFPFRGATATVVLDVQLNGMVHVVSENVLPMPGKGLEREGGGRQMQPQDLGQVLQVCEDIDQWCEWIRSRLE
ncbi:hypothetical protein RB596_002388 [Gaeumannomyces avenae]